MCVICLHDLCVVCTVWCEKIIMTLAEVYGHTLLRGKFTNVFKFRIYVNLLFSGHNHNVHATVKLEKLSCDYHQTKKKRWQHYSEYINFFRSFRIQLFFSVGCYIWLSWFSDWFIFIATPSTQTQADDVTTTYEICNISCIFSYSCPMRCSCTLFSHTFFFSLCLFNYISSLCAFVSYSLSAAAFLDFELFFYKSQINGEKKS